MSSKAENRALITDKKPDTRKCGEGLQVAIYESHGLTEGEIEVLDQIIRELTFNLDGFVSGIRVKL